MSAVLAFDNASIGGVAVPTSAFVRGGSYSPEVSNERVNTTDGKAHFVPVYKGGSASFKMYGNGLVHNTAPGLGVECILKLASAVVATVTALVTASYDEASNTTQIDLKIDPTTDAQA